MIKLLQRILMINITEWLDINLSRIDISICQRSYISRIKRRAYVGSRENIQNSLRSGEVKRLSSAISRYLFGTGHQFDTLKSFDLPNIQSNANLKFSEPTVIKHMKADLFVQKEAVINLSLPR